MATRRQKRKVKRVMEEYKHGELRSSSGLKVTSRNQAIAIAMSESGQSRSRRGRRSTTSTRRPRKKRAK